MLKNTKLFMLCSVAMISFSSYAQTNSAGGVLSFSGAISDTTCTINDGDSDSLTIPLRPITTTQAGTTANTVITTNQKAFDLTFSNCGPVTAPEPNLKIHFSSASISNNGLYLVNTASDESNPSTARNVGFSLATATAPNTVLQLKSPLDTGFTGVKKDGTSEKISFIVSYYKPNTTPAKVGAIQSSVIYTVSYL